MSKIDRADGGPAFPSGKDTFQTIGGDWYGAPGMSLRDWFAGQALACGPISGAASDETIRAAAEWAYRIADAMLAARGRA